MLSGRSLIKSECESFPEMPGIYMMFDIAGKIIYIGKAKNLKNRIVQYLRPLSTKNELMILSTTYVEYRITDSEISALITEAELIRKYKPKFNILLKDDKSFPYILIDFKHKYPRLHKLYLSNIKEYSTNNKKDFAIFGPFISHKEVNLSLKELQKIFKLRSCSDEYFSTRTKPCLQYQIKRCYGPCVGYISEDEYNVTVKEIKDFFEGRTNNLQQKLAKEMEYYSLSMQFEKAAKCRDRIKSLSYVQLKSGYNLKCHDTDIIALAKNNDNYCIELVIYRARQFCGSKSYFWNDVTDMNESELLEYFILQFYQDKIAPKEILVNQNINDQLITGALRKLYNTKTKIIITKSGPQKSIVDNAAQNAELVLIKNSQNVIKQKNNLSTLADLFGIDKNIKRIEIYDNSHIQGNFSVGAMVVVGVNGFNKDEYRIFNLGDHIDTKIGGDDYYMLRTVMNRRLSKIKYENDDKCPDFIIIDGGKGHMNVVQSVMLKLDLKIPFVCMSKGINRNSGMETFYTPNKAPFTLDKNSDLMKYLQILRDEAHNFAIKSHRKKRSKAIKHSELNNINGIGSARKKKLLNHFGSLETIKSAAVHELEKVDGISLKLAQKIYNNFRR